MRFGKRDDRDVAADGTAPCDLCGETVPVDVSGRCELGHRVTTPEIAARVLEQADPGHRTGEAVRAQEQPAEPAPTPATFEPPPGPAPEPQPTAADRLPEPPAAQPVADPDPVEHRPTAEPPPADALDYDSLLRNGSRPA